MRAHQLANSSMVHSQLLADLFVSLFCNRMQLASVEAWINELG